MTNDELGMTKGGRVEKVKRPLLRYFGGKWRIAHWVAENMPRHTRDVEPFGGGASVLLKKEVSFAEVYNDLDREVVNLFRVLRERGDELAELCRNTPFAREEYALSFEPCEEDELEQARRTIIQGHLGFGSKALGQWSGFNGNNRRIHKTPSHSWSSFHEAIPVIRDRLRGVIIENRDAFELFEVFDAEDTLFYLDPPYVQGSRRMSTRYRHEFSDEDHVRLLKVAIGLKGMVMISGYGSKVYDVWLPGWKCMAKNAFTTSNSKRRELLWLNPSAEAALRNQGEPDLFAEMGVGI